MELEPTLASLLEAIQTLTNQVGSLQAQVHTQGQQLSELKAICKETNNLVGDKDQGGAQAKPGPSTGPITPPTHTGEKLTLQERLGLDSRPPSALQEAQALTPRKKRSQEESPKRSLWNA
ncbi:hypothetical protein RHS01_06388 [Rhizoctonia solani]|uniref:Uncharacterized protein n=1 Tax=Rhizoctonia solani TaxID=456999 RepID=A0A8H7IAZ2_9AGAM|nr:hypothetical protein RHS01_06388 [Rhizoctonia solani]